MALTVKLSASLVVGPVVAIWWLLSGLLAEVGREE
jgi:hypothetical protein